MRFGYLILAHDAFDQLGRLVARLLRDGQEDQVFLHIDAKAELPRNFAETLPPGATLVTPRLPVYWGHHSQCDATRALLAAALPGRFDHYHLLSGRDWPLLTRTAIAEAIAAAGTRDLFITDEDDRFAARMDGYCLADRWQGPRGRSTAISWRYVRVMRAISCLATKLMGRRDQPLGPWRRGSQWWSLPHDAAGHILAVLDKLAATKRLRFTQCSDEHVVQTALAGSMFDARFAADNRRFIDWPIGAPSPVILRRGALTNPGDAWFGRKFDASVDDFFYDL